MERIQGNHSGKIKMEREEGHDMMILPSEIAPSTTSMHVPKLPDLVVPLAPTPDEKSEPQTDDAVTPGRSISLQVNDDDKVPTSQEETMHSDRAGSDSCVEAKRQGLRVRTRGELSKVGERCRTPLDDPEALFRKPRGRRKDRDSTR